MSITTNIVERYDAGQDIPTIAEAEGVSTRYVYSILKTERPDRPRKPRTRSSDKPHIIRGLVAGGMSPERVSVVLGISRAYVYRCLKEETQQ